MMMGYRIIYKNIMYKKTKTIIIISAVLVIVGIITSLFFYQNKERDSGFDVIRNIFPFGKGSEETPSALVELGEENVTLMDTQGDGKVVQRFFQIHKDGVAGAYLFEKPQGSEDKKSVVARYIERGVGHIFQTDMSTTQEDRISNTTRLKIYEAVWGGGGRNVVIRYLDDENEETIRSFLIKLGEFKDKKSFLEQEVVEKQVSEDEEGIFLPENMQVVAISKYDDNKIFYLINRNSESIGTIYNMNTNNSTQIFRSVLTQWLVGWPNKNTIALTTKPSGGVAGVLYFLNTDTEKMAKILGSVDGLTTLVSPDGKKVAYSESGRGMFVLNIYDVENKTSQKLPLTTLPEKCVWSRKNIAILYCAVPIKIQSGVYPDEWYQGLVSFSDEIWMIDTETFTTNLLINPIKEAGEEMDATKLILDKNDEYLVFINKKDLSLWGLKL